MRGIRLGFDFKPYDEGISFRPSVGNAIFFVCELVFGLSCGFHMKLEIFQVTVSSQATQRMKLFTYPILENKNLNLVLSFT